MIKRLIICADGTWNEPNQRDQHQSSPTNVVKIASAIKPIDAKGIPQIVYYHSGLGVEGSYLDRINGGTMGVGISRTIRELYLFLVLNYNPGDEVFLFGFSRGAYTVRSLAGFIRNCGILKSMFVEKFKDAYSLYRDKRDNSHPMAAAAIDFRQQHSWPDFTIQFIGVWDTVGSLGIPFPFKVGQKISEFHDVELSSHVAHAYQALAIDEQRKPFAPCIWVKQSNSPASQILEQAWFPGVHSNIGGGYSDSGLSDCALEWMWQKAEISGLALKKDQYPSPNPAGVLRHSMKIWYRPFGVQVRTLGLSLPHSYEALSHAAIQRKALLPEYTPRNMIEFMQKQSHVTT